MGKIENPLENFKRISIKSNLEKADGSYENLSIKVDKDNKPALVVFEDIDKTLLHLEPTYNEIRKAMWGSAVVKDGIEEVSKVHLAGFRLGTMWRELYRMHAIYTLGKEEWKDAELYEREFLAPGKEGEHIDEPGDQYYEFSDNLLKQFDDMAADTVERQAKEDPEFFAKAKIEPMYKLNAIYKRLGVPVVGMTANPRKFATALCKYTGLAENFITCATDTDVPGTKEYKMIWLMKGLEEMGIKIPYDKLLVIGDSPVGDVGSASRIKQLVKEEHPEISASGIVIIENDKELKNAIEKLTSVTDINIQALDYTQVPVDEKGVPKFFTKDRNKFLRNINSEEK